MDDSFESALAQYLRTLTERISEIVLHLDVGPSWLDYTNVVLTTAILLVAIVALSTWRRQKRAEIEDELARRCLVLSHRLRREINFVRNPFSTRRDDEDQFEATRRSYSERWDRVAQIGSELKIAQIEARLLWGEEYLQEANDRFTELQALLWKDIQDTILSLNPNATEGLRKPAEDDLRQADREFDYLTVLYKAPENDPFDAALLESLKAMEEALTNKMLVRQGKGS